MGSIQGVLTTDQAAALLEVHPKNIFRVPGIKSIRRQKVGGAWAWSEEDIKALAKNYVKGSGRGARPAAVKLDKRRRYSADDIRAAHAAATVLMLREYRRIVPGANAQAEKEISDLFSDHFNYMSGALAQEPGPREGKK